MLNGILIIIFPLIVIDYLTDGFHAPQHLSIISSNTIIKLILKLY
jgi:hypothetical protein